MLSDKELTKMIEEIRRAYLRRDEKYPELLAELWLLVKVKGLASRGATNELLNILRREMTLSPVPLPPYLRAWLYKEKLDLDKENELRFLILKYAEGRTSWIDRGRIRRFSREVKLEGIWRELAEKAQKE